MKKRNMKQLHKSALAVLALAVLGLAAGRNLRPGQVDASANPLDIYPVNSRLSFLGKADGAQSTGTILKIKTEYNADNAVYSTSSAMLQTGDVITIDESGDKYSVSFTSSQLPDSQIPLSTAINTAIADGNVVYATMSGDIKFDYTVNASDVTSAGEGHIQILVPAANGASTSHDGKPDSAGFDFGSGAVQSVSVNGTRMTDATKWSCEATNAEAANRRINGVFYHVFDCTYKQTALSANDKVSIVITGLINPAPAERFDSETGAVEKNRSTGSMDAYGIYAIQTENGTELANTISYVGFSKGVKMTVRVMPQLTLKMMGVAKDGTVANATSGYGTSTGCESAVTVGSLQATDAFKVDFGSISNTNFTEAAQRMEITTNVPHGYVVTAIADDQMRVDGNTCVQNGVSYSYCIPGDGNTTLGASQNTTGEGNIWLASGSAAADTYIGSGFGYTAQVVHGDDYLNTAGNPNVQAYYAGAAGHTAGNSWRAFADRQAGDQPVQVFNNLRSTNLDVLEVCYRIMSAATNVPGRYMSTLTYTVTASF